MDSRKIDHLYESLMATENKKLFGYISSVHSLASPPVPLTTAEMHKESGEMIRNANHEVLLEFYKFSIDSDGGREIFQALFDLKQKAEAKRKEINVYLLVNSRGIIAQYLYKKNNPLSIEGLANSEYFKINITPHVTKAFGTLNTKLIVVDSNIAMIRSGDPEASNNIAENQFETAAIISGPIVSIMRSDFIDLWKSYTHEQIGELSPSETTNLTEEDHRSIPCLFISKRENGNPFSIFYNGCDAPYKISLLKAINDATLSIDIMTPNLNDSHICLALAKACMRNVSVNIVMGKYHNHATEAYWGGTNFKSIANIVRQIDKAYQSNLSVRWATNLHGHLVDNCATHTIHAKYVCIDKCLVLTGSSPIDYQSMNYSREADIIFEDHDTAKKFDAKFFSHKFKSGLDHYEDTYFTLYNAIERQAKRIEKSADSEEQKNKALQLRQALVGMSKYNRSYLHKIYLLLETTLPILEIPTSNKPIMPRSYSTLMALLKDYGFDTNLTELVKNKQIAQQGHQAFNWKSGFTLLPPPQSSRLKKSASSPALGQKNNAQVTTPSDPLRRSL
ncbi:MAG: phosphatidylserine/phosphatidylglycerophosphate/cardiolipin synthase family protein [Gammaproteobacteria bacterium]|nr:phosphatidylserine/phosphatidylglycerophosphate/cardiolipin synthase family protein [Gammaproteobacteria bacterium]